MLHILFVILKILGIILAVILGILVLLVCIVLFVPLCYKGEAEGGGTLADIQAHGQVSWLFGLVKVVVDFRNKSPVYSIRIAWKKLGGRSESIQEEGKEVDEEDNGHEEGKKHHESECTSKERKESREKSSGDRELKKHEEISEKNPEADEGRKEHKVISEEKPGIQEETGKAIPTVLEENPRDNEKTGKESRKKPSLLKIIKERFQGFAGNIGQLGDKFKCTIQKLCDKIKEMLRKKDKLTAFITDTAHVNALMRGKRELLKLLGRLSPKVFQADIHYGFEDPSLTGKVLAGFGMLYPFLGDHARIIPDFQEKVLEGSLRIKGRIYAVHLAALAVNMLLSRDVRRTIKDVRKFKL